jgi:hypothetical protein
MFDFALTADTTYDVFDYLAALQGHGAQDAAGTRPLADVIDEIQKDAQARNDGAKSLVLRR